MEVEEPQVPKKKKHLILMKIGKYAKKRRPRANVVKVAEQNMIRAT